MYPGKVICGYTDTNAWIIKKYTIKHYRQLAIKKSKKR